MRSRKRRKDDARLETDEAGNPRFTKNQKVTLSSDGEHWARPESNAAAHEQFVQEQAAKKNQPGVRAK